MKNLKQLNFLFILFAVIALSGCLDKPTGPEAIIWDRDTCARCHMVVSDHLFAAQIRVPEKKRTLKFDDLGGAPLWLDENDRTGDETVQIWVTAHNSTREKVNWLEAKTAWYVPNYTTPMDFGYAAFKEKVEGAVNYDVFADAARAKAAARKKNKTGGHAHMNHSAPKMEHKAQEMKEDVEHKMQEMDHKAHEMKEDMKHDMQEHMGHE